MHTIACAHCKASLEGKKKGTKYCSGKCRKAFIRSSTKTTRKTKPLNVCKFCGKHTKNAHYCSRQCWSEHVKKGKQNRALEIFPRTRFGMWLISNVRRAGTVQILEGAVFQTFTDLLELYKKMVAANGIGNQDRAYELSHLSPVKGKNSVGLLSPSNLTIASVRLNRKLGKKEFGHTCKVLETDLLQCYRVCEKTGDREIMKLINKLTKEAFYRFIRAENLQLPTRSKSNTSYTKEPYSLVDVVREEVVRLRERVDLLGTTLWQGLNRIYDHYFHPKRFTRTRNGGYYEFKLTAEEAEKIQRMTLENRLDDYEIPDLYSPDLIW